MDDDRDLVTRATGGDDQAIDSLLARHLPMLRAFVRLQAGPAIRAKESDSDLVQSVCREILEDVSDFEYRGEAAFKQWLYTTALRKILDRDKFYRREKRDVGREVDGVVRGSSGEVDLVGAYGTFCTPSRHVIAKEEAGRIEAAFEKLPENYREIIALSRVAGLTNAELAAHYGKDEAYCRTLLSRALARLARHLRSKPCD